MIADFGSQAPPSPPPPLLFQKNNINIAVYEEVVAAYTDQSMQQEPRNASITVVFPFVILFFAVALYISGPNNTVLCLYAVF